MGFLAMILYTLMREGISCFETSLLAKATRRHVTEDVILRIVYYLLGIVAESKQY
jgi:hypothetical protein